jgi:regulator of protease activity HflC (stomatin/prohibitin superfamily)
MHRQVSAERSKRAEILESEGQRQSAINIAEGRKQSTILASEAIRAENINKASREAEAILLRANATAQGLEMVAKAILSEGGKDAVGMGVAEKYVDAFGKLAKEGNSVIVPAGLGDMGGMIAQAPPWFFYLTDVNAGAIYLQQGQRYAGQLNIKSCSVVCA